MGGVTREPWGGTRERLTFQERLTMEGTREPLNCSRAFQKHRERETYQETLGRVQVYIEEHAPLSLSLVCVRTCTE